jgi:hypothetical protein
MELLVFIGALIVLDIVALRFGHNSRDDIYRDDRWRRRL